MLSDPILALLLIKNINTYHQKKYLHQLYKTYESIDAANCFEEFVYGCLTGLTIIIYGQYQGIGPDEISNEVYATLRDFVSTRYNGLVKTINGFKDENGFN